MGVSDTSNVDLAAIVNGGEEFIKRMAEYQAAASAYQKALTDLNLGKAAKDAYDEAGRILGTAKAQRDDDMAKLNQEIADAKAALEAWSTSTKEATQAALDEALAKNSEADAKLGIANKAREEAQGIIDRAKYLAKEATDNASTDAAKIVSDAQAQADKILASAKATQEQAKLIMDDAMALKAKYSDAMAKIQSAIVSD